MDSHFPRTFSRRQAMLGAGALIAALSAPRLSRAASGRKAIVVGSGFGGSVAVLCLGQAGYKTTVFERGRHWPADGGDNAFPKLMAPDGRSAWFSDHPNVNQLKRILPIQRYPGLVDRIKGNGLDAIFGAGIGGGSVSFGTFTPQPPQAGMGSNLPHRRSIRRNG